MFLFENRHFAAKYGSHVVTVFFILKVNISLNIFQIKLKVKQTKISFTKILKYT